MKRNQPCIFSNQLSCKYHLLGDFWLSIAQSPQTRQFPFQSFSGLVLKPLDVVDRNNLKEKGKLLLLNCCPNFIFNESSQALWTGYLVLVTNKRWMAFEHPLAFCGLFILQCIVQFRMVVRFWLHWDSPLTSSKFDSSTKENLNHFGLDWA